jgi:hypothetical protein
VQHGHSGTSNPQRQSAPQAGGGGARVTTVTATPDAAPANA